MRFSPCQLLFSHFCFSLSEQRSILLGAAGFFGVTASACAHAASITAEFSKTSPASALLVKSPDLHEGVAADSQIRIWSRQEELRAAHHRISPIRILRGNFSRSSVFRSKALLEIADNPGAYQSSVKGVYAGDTALSTFGRTLASRII